MVHDYYEGSHYRLKIEEPDEEHKEIVQTPKEIYETLENTNNFVIFYRILQVHI